MIINSKIILVGDAAVGKTSIRRKFFGKSFNSSYLATIGADVSILNYQNKKLDETINFKFSIWDLAGQEKWFSEILPRFYKGSSGILLTYDVTNETSLSSLDNWLTDIKKYIEIDSIPLIIIANKIDLKRKILAEEGLKIVNQFSDKFYNGSRKIPHIETSALTGVNINLVLEHLSITLLELKSSLGK
ncbi:MAG: Rab family GTPase [Candidatus Hodarchaeales archaeon]